VVSKSGKVDVANIKTIHEMRLSFKKFRYSIEALYHVLPEATAEKIREMHDFQRMMGEINDLHLLRLDILRFSKRKAGREDTLEEVLNELDGLYASRVHEFKNNLGALNRFWTPASNVNPRG
jgi:CHAD domain-containing protein